MGSRTRRSVLLCAAAVASVVSVDGVARNVWGLAWVDVDAGGHEVCFSDVVPVAVAGLAGAVSLSAGGNSSCAVLALGTARCWGGNMYGQLGDASTADRATPVAVQGL